MVIIKKCIQCKKEAKHPRRGMCLNCYRKVTGFSKPKIKIEHKTKIEPFQIKIKPVKKEPKTKDSIFNIVEDCVVIKMKDVPDHMVGIDLTWLDSEIRKIKDRLIKRL